jgi:hypothetical protein
MKKTTLTTNEPIYLTTAALSKELGFVVRTNFIKNTLRIKPEIEHGRVAFWNNGDVIKKKLMLHISRTLDAQ